MNENMYLAAMKRMDEKMALLKAEEEVNRKGLFRDEKIFNKTERIAICSDVRLFEISSSLMIPVCFLEELRKKLKKYKGFKLYLHYLLERYKIHIVNGLIPHYSNVTTKYQDEGVELKKVGIRPWGSDWAMLQILRSSHGMSMSAIFVYLLKIDCLDFAKTISEYLVKAGIPSIPKLDILGEMHLDGTGFFFYRVFKYQEDIYT